MRILGIDPGLATIGLGLIDTMHASDIQVVEWLTIETAAGLPLADRLMEIRKDLDAYLDDTKPDMVVIERLYFGANTTNGLDVAHARGVILCAIAERGIRMIEASPRQLKSGMTGDGNADKTQMQSMLVQMLKLTEIPKPDDAADGLALAVFGALQQHAVVTEDRVMQ